jgi:hypothetical protein
VTLHAPVPREPTFATSNARRILEETGVDVYCAKCNILSALTLSHQPCPAHARQHAERP